MSAPQSFLDGRVILHAGDCREVLRNLADNSIDSICCDPPYHLQSIVKRFSNERRSNLEQPKTKNLEYINAGQYKRLSGGFMGAKWDGGDIAFDIKLWAECLRVLKPGGYLLAFSSSRTYHRMACAIEDAGLITHPMIGWCFGTGFPKAHSVSKHIDRIAGVEREVVRTIKKTPSAGSENINKGWKRPWAEGVTTMDITAPATASSREWDGWFYGTQSLKPALEPIYMGQKPFERGLNGIQNILKWGTGAINVGACKIPGQFESGWSKSGSKASVNTCMSGPNYEREPTPDSALGRWPANLIHDGSEEVLAAFPESCQPCGSAKKNDSKTSIFDSGITPRAGSNASYVGDSGSAARFFYSAKADSDDRLGSKHPTVKPIDLIQYLVRLATPKGGTCLDLFAGTGATGEACFREGFRAVLIEREPEYISDIQRRMALVLAGPDERSRESIKAQGRPRDDGPLFGGSDVSRHLWPTGCLRNGDDGPFGNDAREAAG